MSISALLSNPQIPDREGFEDYLQNLADLVPTIERCLARLKREPESAEQIAELFRALHNLKGDATICQVQLGVLIAHPLETLLGRMRQRELTFTPLLGELIQLAVDRLEAGVEAQAGGRPMASLRLQLLVDGLEHINALNPGLVAPSAAHLIESLTGNPAVHVEHSSVRMAADLKFFHRLALRFEERSPWLKGRSQRQRRLALDTLAISRNTDVDPQQLEAAVYMHDIGMMFLPEKHWLKPGELVGNDISHIHLHPTLGAGLLERMPDWAAAAEMVAQHHERPNGTGYPAGLRGSAICSGARLLALVDAFEAIMTRAPDRKASRALMRAMSELNASNLQFDPYWVEHFNTMVRQRTA